MINKRVYQQINNLDLDIFNRTQFIAVVRISLKKATLAI